MHIIGCLGSAYIKTIQKPTVTYVYIYIYNIYGTKGQPPGS